MIPFAVRVHEIGSAAEGANRGSAVEGLRKLRENRRPRDGLEALQVAGNGHVAHHEGEVNVQHGHKDHDERRHHGSAHAERAEHRHQAQIQRHEILRPDPSNVSKEVRHGSSETYRSRTFTDRSTNSKKVKHTTDSMHNTLYLRTRGCRSSQCPWKSG